MAKEFNMDNSIKSRNGSQNKTEILSLLEEFEKKYSTVHLSKKVRMGAPGKDPKQFFITAILEFDDQHKEEWLIETSTSYKADRAKKAEFEIENIKKIINRPKVDVKAFYVITNAKEEGDFKKYKRNVEQHKIVTYFDDILNFNEFRNMLAKRCSKYLPQGSRSNILGSEAEKDVAEAFNNPNNIELWNKTEKSKVINSRNFDIVQSLMDKFYPDKKIKTMVAYDNYKKDPHYLADLSVVKNPNGGHNWGKPKTDVLIIITFTDGTNTHINLSVKRPKIDNRKVTAHEGYVEVMLNDLQASMPKNSMFNDPEKFDQLSKALLNFQEAGTAKGMNSTDWEFLTDNLHDLNPWLIDYCLFGVNNRRFNDKQVANTMAVVDPQSGSLTYLTRNEEKQLLLQSCQNHKNHKNRRSSSFGTPFSWSYPSSKRGKKYIIKSTFLSK